MTRYGLSRPGSGTGSWFNEFRLFPHTSESENTMLPHSVLTTGTPPLSLGVDRVGGLLEPKSALVPPQLVQMNGRGPSLESATWTPHVVGPASWLLGRLRGRGWWRKRRRQSPFLPPIGPRTHWLTATSEVGGLPQNF
ncbi:unnamed protein product [Protopolystoma xenopodis]|uniref:Uncharacterized protein n=1 Tax=Protopolystoma xenopodis TaxID=117903 RepID=A0A448XJ82_9PLAT|nr:unnamed protein product [Protopolystoma xenopodis]